MNENSTVTALIREQLEALIVIWKGRARLNLIPPPSDASSDIADPSRWRWKSVGIAQQQCIDELSTLLAAPPAPASVPVLSEFATMTAEEQELARLYRQNKCGDHDCEGTRFSAAQTVLRGTATHREVADAVSDYCQARSSCQLGTGVGYYKPPHDAVCNCGLSASHDTAASAKSQIERLRALPAPEDIVSEVTDGFRRTDGSLDDNLYTATRSSGHTHVECVHGETKHPCLCAVCPDCLIAALRKKPAAAAPEARPADPNLQSPEGAQFEEDHLGVVRDDSCPEATDGKHVYNLADWRDHEVIGRICYKCGDRQSLAGAPTLRAPHPKEP